MIGAMELLTLEGPRLELENKNGRRKETKDEEKTKR
jgi:hypothetical protein